jgi:hypothetical protein
MSEWLYSFPDAVVVFFFTAIAAIAVVVVPWILRPIKRFRPNPDNTDFTLRLYGVLFTLCGFALAMTLVQAQSIFRHAEALVASEAAHINNLDRLLARYGDSAVAGLRPTLLRYANSIVKDEWPAMSHDRDSEPTRLAFVPIAQSVTAISPAAGRQTTIYAEMLKSIDMIMELREERLDSVHIALPAVYWDVVFFAMVVLVLASSAIERTPFRALLLASQAAVLGAFIGVVFITDHPFKGQTSVDTTAFDKAIVMMKGRDK